MEERLLNGDAAGEEFLRSSPGERRALQLLSTPNLRRAATDQSGNEEELLSIALLEEDDDSEGNHKSSFAQALLNCTNVLAGVGALSLPFAFRQTGYLVGSIFMFYLFMVTCYSGKLIGQCMSVDRRVKTFTDIGSKAFGSLGMVSISFIFILELVAALAMFVTLAGDSLYKVLSHQTDSPPVSKDSLYLLVAFVILPTCWTSNLETLSNLSIIGLFTSFGLLFTLIESGFTTEKGLKGQGSFFDLHMSAFVAVDSMARFPYAIGLFTVGFAGHAVFPSIWDSLADKSQFPSLINHVYALVLVLYMGMGLIGYLLFTDVTQEELTLNLYDVAGGSTIVKVTMWLIIINPLTKYALTLNPLAEILWIFAGGGPVSSVVPNPSTNSGSHSQEMEEGQMNERRKYWHCLCSRWFQDKLLRSALVFLSLAVAVFCPGFSSICAFVGAFCSMYVSTIFPFMAYLKLFRPTGIILWVNRSLIVINSILCIVGTIGVAFPPPPIPTSA